MDAENGVCCGNLIEYVWLSEASMFQVKVSFLATSAVSGFAVQLLIVTVLVFTSGPFCTYFALQATMPKSGTDRKHQAQTLGVGISHLSFSSLAWNGAAIVVVAARKVKSGATAFAAIQIGSRSTIGSAS